MPVKKNREISHNEIEIKLRVADYAAMVRRLGKLKARLRVPRNHEMNTLYDTPDGLLMRNGQMLRIRVERSAPGGRKKTKTVSRRTVKTSGILTYKGPSQGSTDEPDDAEARNSYKIRREREVTAEDAPAMAEILEAIGLRPSFRYEKYRTTYILPTTGRLKVELDETPVGNFLELEGTPKAIDRAASLLGYRPADYITKSYGALWLEHKGLISGDAMRKAILSRSAGDMLF